MEEGSGGLQKLREELEAESEGVRVPFEARWLGGASTRARFRERKLLRPSAVPVVLGEAVAGRLCRQGARRAGLRHEVEPFEEARPDAFCNWCCAWGHVAPTAPRQPTGAPSARRATKRPIIGAPLRGAASSEATRAHVVAKCRNCSAPHLSQVNVRMVKKETRQLAKGWRPPSSPHRDRRATAPPEDEPLEGPVTEEGEMEVEMQPRAATDTEE